MKGEYQDQDCKLYLPPMLITARLLYLLFNVNCRRTFNAPIYKAKRKELNYTLICMGGV